MLLIFSKYKDLEVGMETKFNGIFYFDLITCFMDRITGWTGWFNL